MDIPADREHTLARLPRFSSLEPEALVDALDAMLDAHRERIAALTAEPGRASWASVVEPMEVMADELQRLFGPYSHLHNVADNPALREAHETAVQRISAYSSDVAQNADLYACYRHIHDGGEFDTLDTAQRQVIKNALRDFRLGGIDLQDEAQDRVKTLKVEIARLQSRFGQNTLDATQAFRLDVDDENQLAGLPDSVKALAKQNASRHDFDGWSLTLDFPCYQPAMIHLDNRELREALYRAYVTRASNLGPQADEFDNHELIHDILTRRQELARLLGYDNYAALSLATKMAPSTDAVIDFLLELAQQARPAAERELASLSAFAASELGLESLEAWDLGWVAERYREQHFELNQETLKPYFPADRVIQGMFEVAGRLFGIRLARVEGVEAWHPDVAFHSVSDAGGETLGFFYLDLYARDGKRPGAWMDECLVRWRLRESGQAGAQLPVAYLTCNFTPPVDGQPTLLTHDEVMTLFHEFGHGLHHLLTRVEHLAVAGINGVPWDAVELPSQFLENWCWEREALDIFSAHYEHGDTLPDDLFERLTAARHFQAAMQMLRQIEFALFDFELHRDYEPGFDVQALLDRTREQVAVVKPPAFNRFQNTFSHIFAGGYAAGYYSYKWAEVLAADAFERFEHDGVFDAAAGRDFRHSVLEAGGSEDAMVLFKRFRGREPRVDALLRQAGLGR